MGEEIGGARQMREETGGGAKREIEEEIGEARQRCGRKQEEEPYWDAGEARDRDGGGDRGDRQSQREKQKKQTGREPVTKRKKISPTEAESRSMCSE